VIPIAAGQKCLIAGQNGSGKSVLAAEWTKGLDRVVVYDPKDDPAADLSNAAVLHRAKDVIRALPGRVIYRPERTEQAQIVARWDEICAKVMADARRGQYTAVVVHELADLGSQFRIGPAFREVIAKGRAVDRRPAITVILVTQRPKGIPVLTRTEAHHVACFTLLDPDDRILMAKVMGGMTPGGYEAIAREPRPLDHTFWYRGPDLRLRLGSPIPYRA
jgi:hypothetical protein